MRKKAQMQRMLVAILLMAAVLILAMVIIQNQQTNLERSGSCEVQPGSVCKEVCASNEEPNEMATCPGDWKCCVSLEG